MGITLFVAFRLKTDRDDEIIEWLESIGDRDRSYKIREALKTYLNGASSDTTPISLKPASSPLTIKKREMDENIIEANLEGWVEET